MHLISKSRYDLGWKFVLYFTRLQEICHRFTNEKKKLFSKQRKEIMWTWKCRYIEWDKKLFFIAAYCTNISHRIRILFSVCVCLCRFVCNSWFTARSKWLLKSIEKYTVCVCSALFWNGIILQINFALAFNSHTNRRYFLLQKYKVFFRHSIRAFLYFYLNVEIIHSIWDYLKFILSFLL